MNKSIKIIFLLVVFLTVLTVINFFRYSSPKGEILEDGAFIDNSEVEDIRIDPWCLTHECKG